jgi:hypothetical protein
MAGRYWFEGFMKRQPELKLKNAKNLAVHRAICCNPARISGWFTQYETWLSQFQIYHPDQVWNVDETGLMDMPPSGVEVVGEVGVPACQIVSGEKPKLTTVLTYISASGRASPPMLVFTGAKVQTQWKEYLPQDQKFFLAASKSGYINTKLFHQYGGDFISWLSSIGLIQKYRALLILMDGHGSHLFNYNYMDLMRHYKVQVAAFPPHASHLCQPLDDVPFAVLKSKWASALGDKNREIKGRALNKAEFMEMLAKLWREIFTKDIIREGFKNCGIWPIDESVAKYRRMAAAKLKPPPPTEPTDPASKWLTLEHVSKFLAFLGILLVQDKHDPLNV